MTSTGWLIIVVVLAGGAGTAGYFLGRKRGGVASAMGRGDVRGNITAKTIDPKKAAAAIILSAPDKNIQKV
jgi:hypothetical protein